jgi:hypothetical protein
MEQVYILFEMVRVSCVFILNEGCLVGMISRYNLLNTLKRLRAEKKQKRS